MSIEDNPAFRVTSFRQESCSYVVSGQDATLRHATFIVSFVSELLTKPEMTGDLTFTLHNHLAWLLDSLATIRNLVCRWPSGLTYQETGAYAISCCLTSIRNIVSWLRDEGVSVLKFKGYMLLVDICADIVEMPAVLATAGFSETFCSTLDDLVYACRTYEPVATAVGIRLVPALEIIAVDSVSPLIPTSKLQV